MSAIEANALFIESRLRVARMAARADLMASLERVEPQPAPRPFTSRRITPIRSTVEVQRAMLARLHPEAPRAA